MLGHDEKQTKLRRVCREAEALIPTLGQVCMVGEPKIGSYLICSTHEIALLLTNQGVKYALLWQKDRLGSDWSANCPVSYQNTNAGDLESYLRTIQVFLW